MTTRRNFLASLVAAVAMAPQLLRFRAELPEVTEQTFSKSPYETATFDFQWFREHLEGGKFPVGMGDTYTIKEGDIGKLISVTITA